MLKVVLCIPTLLTAGAERFVTDLAINLKNKKLKVCIAITRKNIIGTYGDLLRDNGIEIIDLSGKNYFEMCYKQYVFFNNFKPDVIHTNIGSLLHVMVVAKLVGIKARVYTVHNDAKMLYGNSKFRKLIFRLAFSFFDFVPVAICRNVKNTFIDSFGEKYKNMYMVNNGVDISRFHSNDKLKTDSIIHFINTGSMYVIKNQIEILVAFSELIKKYKNIRLTILGDGSERIRLEKYIKDNRLEEYVNMPGICSNVNDYLSDSDVYISASLTEGLPLSMLEAMASGLPVITSNAGGCNDLVCHGKNGFIYSKNDKNSLVKYMEIMIINENQRKEFSQQSREIAKKWSIENCTDGYNELYKILSK